MNEENKLDEVTAINTLKDQLEEFSEYRKAIELAINEMHKTIVNLSERVKSNETIRENVSTLKTEIDEIKKPIEKMTESVGKINSLTNLIDRMSASLERANNEVGQMKKAIESVDNKADKSLELKKRLGELVKFLVSD